MARFLLNAVTVLLLTAAAAYLMDAAAWHLRGRPSDELSVSQVTAAKLKRDREEYYFDGDITITCARSAFPQLTGNGTLPTCWYLRQHRIAITRP